jgi:transcriptional regulator with XRE-family HTH domain
MNWVTLVRNLNPGLKQDDIAARYGLHQSQISRILAGTADIKISTLGRIATSEGLTAWQLVKMAEEGHNRSAQ